MASAPSPATRSGPTLTLKAPSGGSGLSLAMPKVGGQSLGELMVSLHMLMPEQHEQVQHLVSRLPTEKRTVFRLVHELEMTVRDAAEQLGIPEGTAKSRLYYARKQLAHDWQALETPWEER